MGPIQVNSRSEVCFCTRCGGRALTLSSFHRHVFIVQYKTAYYSVYLSVALALCVCGVPESYMVKGETVRPYELALLILLPLEEYFQIQDDFLNYAWTPEQIGRSVAVFPHL